MIGSISSWFAGLRAGRAQFACMLAGALSLVLGVHTTGLASPHDAGAATQEEDLAQTLLAGMRDVDVRAAGREVYDEACLACHGRVLEGATGPRLTDGEWLHGGAPEDILASIKTGFLQKGMPGFEGVYSEAQLRALASFILSQRAGWANARYEIRAMDALAGEDFDYQGVDGLPLVKEGVFHSGLANFGLAEMPHYAFVVEGELYVPFDKPATLYVRGRNTIRMMVQIHGEEPTFGLRSRGRQYPIEAGTRQVRLVYAAREGGFFNGADLPLALVDPEQEKLLRGPDGKGLRDG